MVKKKTKKFKYIYFAYLCVLIVLAVAAILYVKSLLTSYEISQPDHIVQGVVDQLKKDASNSVLWTNYSFPEVEYGSFEENVDLKSLYENALIGDGVKFSLKQGTHDEDELVYKITSDDISIAEVNLRAVGEPVTKLAVFTIQQWEVESIKFNAEKQSYKIDAPSDFFVIINGKVLTKEYITENNNGTVKYLVEGLYLFPDVTITDHEGREAEYKKSGTTIKTVFYDYSLTLPMSLSVYLNGEKHGGEALDDGTVQHAIRVLQKPEVVIKDLYGNTLEYTGGSKLPLTYLKLTIPETYSISVDGNPVSNESVTFRDNPEYEHFKQYVEGLPRLADYNISVLKDDVDISILDPKGNPVEYDRSLQTLDLTEIVTEGGVPAEIAAEVDVLRVAEDWSLFMTKDLPGMYYGFSTIALDMIEGSHIYEVARKWVNSIDITFINVHTLGNPPFTNEEVKNFTWLTDNCFSVDISFDKHMILSNGEFIDSMNDRMHFVKYDTTNDWVNNPTWKLVNIKEIVNNAE